MRIRLYGRLGDAIGPEAEVEAPDGSTVAEVRRLLGARHPAASEALGRSRACLKSQLIGDDQRVRLHDVLEFLPPVSGG